MRTQPPFTIEQPSNPIEVKPLLPVERIQRADRKKNETGEKRRRGAKKTIEKEGGDALPKPPDISGKLGKKYDQRG